MNTSEFKNIIWDYTRKINENANNIFNPICEQYGLTILQARILMELHKFECRTIGSLAEAILVAGTNISSMCKKLDRMGLLKRVRDRDDERIVKVVLTDKGTEVVLGIEKYFDEKISQNIISDTEETLNDIVKGMKKLNDLLQNMVPVKE